MKYKNKDKLKVIAVLKGGFVGLDETSNKYYDVSYIDETIVERTSN